MRLHTAIEHMRNGAVRTMEEWPRAELDEMVRFVLDRAPETIEFTFDHLDPDEVGDTLQTFIAFANEMWDGEIAPIPHDAFWVSWKQKVRDQRVHMAAFCERVTSPIDQTLTGLSIRVMFDNHRRDRVILVNQTGRLVAGDHRDVIVNYVSNESSSLIVQTGFAVVKALLGALATPQAIRREERAPEKLNKARARKGKEPIRPLIVIDVRASQQAAAERRADGGWIMRPHWRRGHIRRLADGRLIPIPPCCVNMETGVPIKPEYVVRI